MISSIVPDFNSHYAFKIRSSARVCGTGFLRLFIRSSLKSLSYEMWARLSTVLCRRIQFCKPCKRRKLPICTSSRIVSDPVIYLRLTRSLLRSLPQRRENQHHTPEINSLKINSGNTSQAPLISFHYPPRAARPRRRFLGGTVCKPTN